MAGTVHVRASLAPEHVARARSTGGGAGDRPGHRAPWQQEEQGHHYSRRKKRRPTELYTTYLPTYLPYLWETKKEIMGLVKVGYYTN